MKAFIKNILLFSALVLVVAIVLQVGISWRIKGGSVTGYDNLEQTGNVNADLVLMGSSRCSVHFDPHFFDTAFHLRSVNIGMSGHGEMPMIMLRLKDYLSRNRPPRYAIFSFDPGIWPGEKVNRNFILKDCFARYAFMPKEKDLPVVDYFRFNAAEKYLPLYALVKYKLLFNSISLEQKSLFMTYGYERLDKTWDTLKAPIARINNKAPYKNDRYAEIRPQLNELQKLCDQNNIKLMCIETPVYNSVFIESEFAKSRAMCSTLNIPFVDADYAFIRNNPACFFDKHHLNTFGVTQMNNMLYKDSGLRTFLKK